MLDYKSILQKSVLLLVGENPNLGTSVDVLAMGWSSFHVRLHLVLHQVIIFSGKPKRLPGKGRLTLTKARYPRSKITLCTCSQSQVVYCLQIEKIKGNSPRDTKKRLS